MRPNIFHIACLRTLLFIFNSWTRAEIYSAVVQMEPLLETHKRMINDLDNYILKEERRLAVLKSHLELYRFQHDKAMEDIPNYVGNPINAFILIKRLTADLKDIEDSIKVGSESVKNITMKHADAKYPTLEDLAGVVEALVRLQKTYRLDVRDLADGKLKYGFPMTAADCLDLARALFHLENYENSLAWSMESLRKFKEETLEHTITEVEILEFISYSYYLMDDIKSALEWTKKLLELDPRHPRARSNVKKLKRILALEEKTAEEKHPGGTGDEKAKSVFLETDNEEYEALCRGDTEISSDIAKRLHCRYLTEHHPFLRLAPIRAEQLYIDPDVFMFHEVISGDEIELIKGFARPKLERAMFDDPNNPGKSIAYEYRTSQTAWLHDEESDAIARVSQRVADMTGLDVTSAEGLQVCNYGIGGHYEPHYDFERMNEINFLTELFGHRIATVMFYMSEVAQGGATVFPRLGLSVRPARRAALFWLNLLPSGAGDAATRHAACPVLRGSKWVSNKWIRQSGQEFMKPCNLNNQESSLLREIPRAVPEMSRWPISDININ